MLRRLLFPCAFFGFFLSASASAQFVVSPESLTLSLGPGEVVVENVSLTIEPLCIRPIDVDVVPSDPAALVSNLTGVVTNGCGGDTSHFDIQFVGDGQPGSFDLQFVDAELGGVLAVIPVKIDTTLGGRTSGTNPRQTLTFVSCRNLTSGQQVGFVVVGDAWDCEENGLTVSPGDRVMQTVIGLGVAR